MGDRQASEGKLRHRQSPRIHRRTAVGAQCHDGRSSACHERTRDVRAGTVPVSGRTSGAVHRSQGRIRPVAGCRRHLDILRRNSAVVREVGNPGPRRTVGRGPFDGVAHQCRIGDASRSRRLSPVARRLRRTHGIGRSPHQPVAPAQPGQRGPHRARERLTAHAGAAHLIEQEFQPGGRRRGARNETRCPRSAGQVHTGRTHVCHGRTTDR